MNYKLLKSLYYKDKEKYLDEYNKRIESVSTIKLKIKNKKGNPFFIVITTEVVSLIESILNIFRKLDKLVSSLPKVAVESLQRDCIIEEILLTNNIEGVHSTRKEIADILDNVSNRRKKFNGLVRKYKLLLENEGKDIPLSNSYDLRAVYDELVLPDIEKNEDRPDGIIFRKESVSVMSPTDKEKHKGILPEEKIIEYVDMSLDVLNDKEIPNLIKIAIIHYLIGYIHPFYDGNGRTSRFISSYLLIRYFDTLVAYRLSYAIKNSKGDYYKAFEIGNDEKNLGDITPFVLIFLHIIYDAACSQYQKVKDKKMILNYYQTLLKNENKLFNDKYGELKKSILFILIQNTLFDDELLNTNNLVQIVACTGRPKGKSTIKKAIYEMVEDDQIPLTRAKDGRQCFYHIDLEALSKLLEE